MLKRNHRSAAESLEMTKAIVAEQHIKIIKDFEEGIENCIAEGVYNCVGTFTVEPFVIDCVKIHFLGLGYAVDTNHLSDYITVTIKWDEKSLQGKR